MKLGFFVLIIVLIKFFVLFLLDGSSLHQTGLKLTLMGAAKGYLGLATCECIFRRSIGEFISTFSVFVEVQTVMVAEFYGVIYAMEEAKKMGLTNV